MTEEQKKATVALLLQALLDTVKDAGEHGVPSGVMYAALMGRGITLESFNVLMAALVFSGKVTKCGHVYYAV